jgi:hypothetical protein
VIARMLAGAVLLGAVAAPVAPLVPFGPSIAQATGLGAGGEFHRLPPTRIYDSRPETPLNEPVPGPKPATNTAPAFSLGILGEGGVPVNPADVLAVVVNITVIAPTGSGWLNAYGNGAPAGTASIVNFAAGQTVPNIAIVRPGADGRLAVQMYTAATNGSAHVAIDVFGWFSTSGYSGTDPGARVEPIAPGRLFDSRAGGGALGQRTAVPIMVRGATLTTGEVIPDDPTITGVMLNVTAVNDQPASSATFVSVLPADPAGVPPTTSNLNVVAGQIKANMVFAPIGPDGRIWVYNDAGSTNVVVDVAGFLRTGSSEPTRGRLIPLTTPFRVFDTREATWGSVALGPKQSEDWSFADFASSVKVAGVPAGPQLAVIGNLTSASLGRQAPSAAPRSYLTVFPADAAQPGSSNLNMVEGPAVPNMAILKYGAATTVRVYNDAGYSHYLFDASAIVLA